MTDTTAPQTLFARGLDAHLAVAEACRETLAVPFEELVAAAAATIQGGGKILFLGNGGSAADAQHLATELVVRFRRNRPAIPALALTTDTSALTAIGNDLGFERLFARQIEALGAPGDLVIGFSTSGRSANVTAALHEARSRGLRVAGLTGAHGGDLTALADTLLCVPSTETARIQEMHIFLGHMLCEALEAALGLDPERAGA